MLIFVSDLHLADHPQRGSFATKAFLRELTIQLGARPKDDTCTLVLLGDVFELLKAGVWLTAVARPWHPPAQSVADTALQSLRDVKTNNEAFFEGLAKLRESDDLRVVYVPGNHDRLLASDNGGAARAELRKFLDIPGSEEPFDPTFTDLDHGVHAQHGHEFDSFNYPDARRPRFVAGDVVVVELVCALPHEVAKALEIAEPKTGQFAPELRFLHELDNVLPQDAEGLLAWIQFSIERLEQGRRKVVRDAVIEALRICLGRAREQARLHGTMSRKMSAFLSAVDAFIKLGGVGTVSGLASLEPQRGDEVLAVARSAQSLAQTQITGPQETYLFVAGHTHYPMHRPIAVGRGRIVTYLNSGTWRRVYLCVPQDGRKASFSTFNEESMLIVQRRVGDAPPAYDFRRLVRGV